MYSCVRVWYCIQGILVYLADGVDLQCIHTNTRIINLQLTIATVNHKHYTIHCKCVCVCVRERERGGGAGKITPVSGQDKSILENSIIKTMAHPQNLIYLTPVKVLVLM